jgi:hypothetical protein
MLFGVMWGCTADDQHVQCLYIICGARLLCMCEKTGAATWQLAQGRQFAEVSFAETVL